MNTLTDEQRRLVTEVLTHEPFECSHVFFFVLKGDQVTPMNEESKFLYEHYRKILDKLPDSKVIEGWPGNIIAGPQKREMLRFYASYRFENIILVVSKEGQVDSDQQHLPSPFNTYFINAICASISPIIGVALSHKDRVVEKEVGESEKSFAFTEFEAWRQCRDLWRQKYPGMWLAIKDGMPLVKGKTLKDLDQQVREKGLKPPVLYAPPEGEEKTTQILSTTADPISQTQKRRN